MSQIAVKAQGNSIEKNIRPGAVPYLLTLPEGIMKLEKLGEIIFLPKDHVIIEAEQETVYCYLVKKGRVFSYESFPNGEERIYHLYEKNALFLESELIFSKKSKVSYKTAMSSELIRIKRSTMLAAMKKEPQLALEVMEVISVKRDASMEQVRYDKKHTIAWKICDLFFTFASHYGIDCGNGLMIREKFSQQTIANLLGVNRITAVRAIKNLKDLGLIHQTKGFYYISDMENLAEYQRSVSGE